MSLFRKWYFWAMAVGLALSGALAYHQPAAAEDVSCTTSLGAITVGNLTVPSGATCTLNGTQVTGTIFVRSNATLHASLVRVNGNVQADGAAMVNLYTGSIVGGNVQVKKSGSSAVRGVTIAQDLIFDQNNQYLTADGNMVSGNLQATKNRGGVAITYNTIGGNLQCKDNAPPPTGAGNSVAGSVENQCIGFDMDPPATPTPVPATPSVTPVVTATPTPPAGTPGGLTANADAFTLNDSFNTISAPGLLANDTYSSSSPVVVILVRGPRHGTLGLGQSGDFSYQVSGDYLGTDSFEYLFSQNGSASNTAQVNLTITDTLAPLLEWVSPIGMAGRYDVFEGEQVTLEVEASDNHSITQVSFTRWDAVMLERVTIAEITQPPYRTEVSASSLNLGWNQINASVFDAAGNRSEMAYIWLFQHEPGVVRQRLFLPQVASFSFGQ